MNLFDIVNEIIGLAEVGNILGRGDVSVRRFGLGDNVINFANENNFKYIDAISRAFHSDSEVERTYTLEKYESLLIDHFREFMLESRSAKKEDVASFDKKLKTERVKIFSVFRDIHGIILKNSQAPLSLGVYTVYDFATLKEVIESKTELNHEYIWFNDNPKYLIEWKAEARHFEKAIEIADEHFERFELILRYVIGNPTTRFEVGVLNYQGWRHRHAYVFSDEGQISSSATKHGSIEPITLDDPYFLNEEFGYKTVWEIAAGINLNKFQKRIILAIEWIGQSMAEPSPQSAFLKAAIALEIIFTYNEKTIINPSILNQISESTALILGNSINERIEIESKVKKLYGLRSAIVHSGNKDISKTEHENILGIARSVVTRLLTSDRLKSVVSVEKLYAILKEIKYSGNAI